MRIKNKIIFLLIFALTAISISAFAEENKKFVAGNFEITGYLDTVAGFQRFSNDTITEVEADGSYAGVLGEWLPAVTGGPPPSPGQTILGTFVPKLELDISRRFGDRARLRADISFGRGNSGSLQDGIVPNHVYAAVRLDDSYNVELVVGRFGLQAGYEPFRMYDNDTISWSSLWRSSIYPPSATGIQLSADLTPNFTIFFTAANGVINDSLIGRGNLPSFLTTLEWQWGNPAFSDMLVITGYTGPEIGGNSPLTYGGDITMILFFNERLKLGFEVSGQGDNSKTQDATASAGALVNLLWRVTPTWSTVAKFCVLRQWGDATTSLNLTGTSQRIYETSLGVLYQLTDSVVTKGEFRIDSIDPDGSRAQTVPGAAFSMSVRF